MRWALLSWLAVVLALGVGCSAPAAPSGIAASPASGAAAPAPAAATPALATPASQTPVVLAASENVTSNVFVWLARDQGLFQQYNVAIDLQTINAINAIKALVAGQLDGVLLGSPEVVAARASGMDLTIVAVFVSLYNQIMVVPPEITSVEQLRGRTVGVITKTSVNGVGTVAGLRALGLETPRDYQVFETGVAGVYTGLANQLMAGNIDAAALEAQLARRVVAQGYRELYDQAAMGTPGAAGALTFRTEYLRAHPEVVQQVVDTLIQGVRYAKSHREETLEAFRTHSKLDDPAELDFVYERVVQQLLSAAPYPAPEQFPDLIEAMAAEQPAVRSLDVSTLIDRRFVDDALRRMGAPAR
ncbi:MAG TPA: ABC transporter substrate-binding protein [Chloroflexota bacterium]|nr:ABC transporter substrate-binding protein [Chloroflexota bacterium]